MDFVVPGPGEMRVGDEPVELIVSELPPPITDVLPPHRPTEEA